MVFFLHGRLQRKGWTRPQKRIMKEILCALAQLFIPEGDPEMLALHDQHSEDSFAEQHKAALAEAGAMMEDVLGVSLDGKDGFESVGFAWSSSCLGARPSVPQRCPGT